MPLPNIPSTLPPIPNVRYEPQVMAPIPSVQYGPPTPAAQSHPGDVVPAGAAIASVQHGPDGINPTKPGDAVPAGAPAHAVQQGPAAINPTRVPPR